MTVIPFEAPSAVVREPPNVVDVEVALLGAILLQPKALDQLGGTLTPEHFFLPVHGRIYEACRVIAGQGGAPNPVTLKHYFAHDDALSEAGGPAYLARLAGAAVTILNVPFYALQILDAWARRELIKVASVAIEDAYAMRYDQDAPAVLEALVGQAQETLGAFDATERREIGLERAMAASIERAEAAHKMGGAITGIPTGLAEVDDLLGGFHPGELSVVAARPGMGKTAFGLGVAEHAAKHGHGVAFLSLEMPAEQLAMRRLAAATGISAYRIRRGKLGEPDWYALDQARAGAEGLPLVLVDASGMTVEQIAGAARRLARRRKLGLVVVDYLQLVAPSESAKRRNRVDEVTEISAGLKRLAVQMHLPVLALAQLNRGLEQRDDKRPRLSDLRDSGAIEQDADVIAFIYRKFEYLRRAEPAKPSERDQWEAELRMCRDVAELIVAKQRQGPTDTVMLRWDAETTTFRDAPARQEGML